MQEQLDSCEGKTQSEVGESIDRLGKTVTIIEESCKELTERLGYVSIASPLCDSQEKQADKPRCALDERLNAFITRLDRVQCGVRAAIANLHI